MQSGHRRWLAYGAVCAAVWAVAAPVRADDAAVRLVIQRMFDVGWSVAPAARTAADGLFDEARQTIGPDGRLITASALVLMQQRRYNDADKRFDELLVGDENNLLALRGKVWLAATFKNYPQALLAAERMSASLPVQESQDEASESEVREQLAFLGRIFGFLAGPAGDKADQTARKTAEKKIIAKLSDGRRAVFEDARDGVLQKYVEMTDAKLDTEEKNKKDRAADNEQTLADAEKERAEMADRAKELGDRREKLRKELADQLDELNKQDRPLQVEYARLEARAAPLNRDLAGFQLEINRLEALAARERDPNLRQQYLRESDRLAFLLNRIAGELRGLERQADVIAGQRADLARRAQQLQNQIGGQVVGIDKELSDQAKKEKRLGAIESKAKKPVSGVSQGTLALNAQVAALITFDKFPLEEARTKLLESFK